METNLRKYMILDTGAKSLILDSDPTDEAKVEGCKQRCVSDEDAQDFARELVVLPCNVCDGDAYVVSERSDGRLASGVDEVLKGPNMTEVTANLEADTLKLFLYIAGEAKDWDGTPPLEGLMPFSREDKGRLMQLKKKVLLFVEEVDRDNHQIHFTRAGRELAAQHGVELK